MPDVMRVCWADAEKIITSVVIVADEGFRCEFQQE